MLNLKVLKVSEEWRRKYLHEKQGKVKRLEKEVATIRIQADITSQLVQQARKRGE